MEQNIGAIQQLGKQLPAFGAFQVDNDASFVGVEVNEHAALFRIQLAVRERASPTRHVTFGRLDFDNVGA